MNRIAIVLLTLLSAISLGVTADPRAAIKLWVKPGQCALKNKNERCQVNVLVSWQLSEPRDICLVQDDTLLQCYEQSMANELEVPVDSSKDILFSLIDADTQAPLQRVTFPVMHANKAQIHLRKVPWRVIL